MLTLSMSAFKGKADIPSSLAYVRYDPKRTLLGTPRLSGRSPADAVTRSRNIAVGLRASANDPGTFPRDGLTGHFLLLSLLA